MSMDGKRKQSVPTKYEWIRDAVRTASFSLSSFPLVLSCTPGMSSLLELSLENFLKKEFSNKGKKRFPSNVNY